jgi:DNA-binding response OmpR family regulator
VSKILLVEDDKAFAEDVSVWLRKEQHVVESVATGAEALEYLTAFAYDIVILDWNLPDTNGASVCKSYRLRGGVTPVLMLTGNSDIDSKERGLDSGADDYIVKPPALRELSARIRALLRRQTIGKSELSLGNITIVPESRKVQKDGSEVELTPREYALLEFLARHRGVVFSNEQIIDRVWKSDTEASPHAVRICVNRLRQKLFDRSSKPTLKTVYGTGYVLE